MPENSHITQRVQTVLAGETDIARWSNPDNLEKSWEGRSEFAAKLIPKGTKVLDLGCGSMAIEKYLDPSCQYVPADLVKRDERTLHCDINAGIVPAEIRNVDVVLLLGVIEYVFDLPKFLKTLAASGKRILVSYCDVDTSGLKDFDQRAALGWVNSFSVQMLRDQFAAAGLKVIGQDKIDGVQSIYTLVPSQASAQVKRVGVLSFANLGNFGDRLGMHLLSSVMPSNAAIERLYFEPWKQSEGEFDLLILGIGNSVYAPLLTEQVLELVSRSKVSIGIFGTQYREDYKPEQMKTLVGALDYWFARYEEDLALYAVPGTVCEHLGDWLVREFMMSTPTNLTSELHVGAEIWQNLPLDRVIEQIQSHRKVFSGSLHPLLCALTSAEEVGYKDQRSAAGLSAGKFQSMLMDIFGRTYPEGEYWSFDRVAVARYRDKVIGNIRKLERVIHEHAG